MPKEDPAHLKEDLTGLDTSILDVKIKIAEPSAGSTFVSNYEVISTLGSGGMSVVYKVRHKMLDKLFALKLLRPDRVLDETTVKRFKLEAQAASRLIHPHIARVTDFGVENEQMRPYLVMDYAEGQSLSDLIKQSNKLSQDIALDLSIQVCSAMEFAHKNGVIHRDLKPSNIMVQPDSSKNLHAMVVDFGIAKLINENESNDLTKTGEVFGSPMYMSPEQCHGVPLDGRTDIYSMGCVLYEMLTGKPPFNAESTIDLLMMQVSQPAPPMKAAGVSPDMEAVVFKALEKDRSKRYQSMADFENDLKAIKQGLPTTAYSASKEYERLKLFDKTKTIVLRSIAGVAFAAAAIFFIGKHDPSAMTHNKVTSNKLASLSSPAQYAQRAERFLHRHNYQAAVSDFSAAIEANPPELKQYLCRRSTAYLHFRDYTEAEEDANKCLKLDPNYAFAYIVKAEAESKQLKLKECLADAKNALELCKGNNALDQSLRVRADISCGYTYYRLGELAKAEQYYRAGLQEKPNSSFAHYGLAETLFKQRGKEQEALTEVTSALNPGNTDHCYDRAFRLRALIYESLKNYDQASVDINKAARINSNLSSMQAEVKRIEYEKDNASKNHG